MPHTVFATLDGEGQPVRLPPGQPFTTHRLRLQDDSDAAAHGGAVGDVVAVELQHAWTALELFPDEALERYGVVRFTFDDAAWGETFTGVTLSLDNAGALTAQPIYEPRPLADLKLELRAAATAHYDARIALGFPAPGLGVGETLQLRDEADRTNWLALKDSCTDAILEGHGDQPCALPVRTTANTSHQLTYAQTAQLIRDLRTWGAGLQSALWTLKDAISAAADVTALAAIDVAVGWPS